MLQQQEVVELVNDINQRQDGKSFSYALAAGFMALMIMMFGLTMLYSTSFATVGEKFFHAQLKWAVIGLFAMGAVIFIGYRKIGSWSLILMGVLAVLLIWASFFSPEIKGAHRWIVIPGVSMRFQPSEMAKVVLALFGAKVVSDQLRSVANWRTLFTQMWLPVLMIGGILGLVICGKDLGTTLLLSAAMFLMFFSAGLQKRFWLLVPLFIVVLACYIIFLDPERMSRTVSFWNPGNESLRSSDGYQLWNSWLALGSGGWTGIGFMESRMKQSYLPEAHTDFILAVVGEELGYIGMLCVIAAYLTFGYFGMKIALNSRSRFGMLLAQTITLIIVLQAAINIGVISGALPTKGISAPLISYGGSNLLMNMIMVGLLVSVGLENVPGLTDNWPFRKSK
ncbi:MAG: cell division protein FtsW [Lentisphaeria bacterium]|nr:cell division protein FtsW [Lentisphaeria bacterium]